MSSHTRILKVRARSLMSRRGHFRPALALLLGALLTLCAAAPATAAPVVPATVTSSTSWAVGNALPPTSSTTFAYGTKPPALVPIMGDWDKDGTRTPGIFQGGVFKLSNTLPPGAPTINVTFGDPRGFPVVGDFTGDGYDDVAVYRNGLWQVRIEAGGIGSGGAVSASDVTFGAGSWPSTIPVAGDWNGDGVDGIGTFTMGTGQWVLRQTTGGADLPAFTYNPGLSPYPVVGDWDADGDDTVGVRSGTAWLLNNQNDGVDDGGGAEDITFNFGAVNDFPLVGSPNDVAPVAVDDAATVPEDSGATAVSVLGNDTDTDGGPKIVFSVTQPVNGTVAITGGGTGLTYAPNANYCNSPPGTALDTFTYRLNNATGSTATVSMTVTCVDDEPVAVNDSATVAQGAAATAVAVLANDTDIDGGPKSVFSVVQPANGTVVITGGGTGLTYQPNANYCNSPPGTALDTFSYRLNNATGSTATVSMTVTCSADAPPTAVADSKTVAEDSGATAIDVLANDTDPDGGPKSVFSVTQPANGTVAITGGGTGLTYQPNANYCNSSPPGTTPDTFTYRLNNATGSTATVSVTVTCVDDPPVAVDDSGTVGEDASATPIVVMVNDTDIDGGPKNIASVTQPANGTAVITGGGTGLTYQPAANYCNDPPGTSPDTFTYTLNGGSIATVSVTVTCVNDAPVADNDPFGDALANTRFVVGTTSTGPRLTVSGDVLDGDTDVDTPVANLTAGPASITSAQCAGTCTGNVTMEADGQFTYDPKPGFTGTDTFTYTVNDNDADAPANQSSTGTVTITVVGPLVWYVDGDAPAPPAGRAGTSHAPSNTLSALSTGGSLDGLDGTGDTIFVYGAGSSYTGGLVLEAQQRLIGEPHSLDIDPSGPTGQQNDLVAAGGSNPVIVNASGNGLTLSTANFIQGISLGNASGVALFGSSVSSATMNHVTPGSINNTTGQAVNVSGGTLSMVFSSVSSTGGAQAIRLDNTAGAFIASGGTLSNATGTDVLMTGNNSSDDISFQYDGMISDDSGPLINISNQSGGLKEFNGPITDLPATPDNGGGISLTNNSVGSNTFRFDGGLTLSTGTSNAIFGRNGGALAITDPGGVGVGVDNTLTTTTGTPLDLGGMKIHDDDLTFRSIASNGAANGIAINSVGSPNPNGRLFVTGNGGACTSAASCSGGAIQGSTGAGIALTGVNGGATLTRMALTGGGDDGIRATGVDDLDLADSIVLNNGNSHAGGAEERGLDYLNVTGTPQILRTTVSGSDDSNAHIRNTVAGSTTLTVDASTFSGSKFNAGLRLRGEGTSVMNATVTGSVFSLNADPGFSMQTDSSNTAQQALLFNNNEVSGGSSNAVSGRPQVSINADSASTVKATVTNNKIKSAAGSEVILNTLTSHTGTFDAKVNSNSIGDSQPGALDALADGGSAIWGWAHGGGITRMEIRNNTVANWGGRGMELSHNEGTGDADYTVTGNVLSAPDVSPNTFEGIYIFSGGASGDASDVCVDMENNDIDGIGRQGVSDIALDRSTGNLLRFADFNDTSVPNLQTNLRAKNPASPALTVETFSFGPTATTDTACDLPVGTP